MAMGRRAGNAAAARSGAPAMWAGISDESLSAELVLPEQFHDMWQHSGSASPERALAVAVLAEALHDLVRYRFGTNRRTQRLYWEAYTWVMDDGREWPFSFVNLCDRMGIDVAAVRQRLRAMGDAMSMPLLDKAA